MNFENLRCLVLNADFTPMGVMPDLFTIPVRDAVHRVLSGSCSVIAEYDQFIKTPSLVMRWPSVILRKHYQHVPQTIALTKTNIWIRDGASCNFCGVELKPNEVTIDHVKPRSHGGTNSWLNLVCSCWNCNQEKGSSRSGHWKPLRPPHEPTYWQLLKARQRLPLNIHHPSWTEFLPDWEGGFVVTGPEENRESTVITGIN